jgi:hypothetical protein
MATPQENTVNRMAADLLIALVHNNRLIPPHHDNQIELAKLQSKMLNEAYQGLVTMIKAVKIKEVSLKRMATDVLIAAIHTNRFHPNLVAPEQIIAEQIKVLTDAYQDLVESFMGVKEN